MHKLEGLMIQPSTSIVDAMSVIDKNSRGIVFICESKRLLATLTDGDIRRYIISGKPLIMPALEAANTQYHALPASSTRKDFITVCEKYDIHAVPGLDDSGNLICVYFNDDKIIKEKKQLHIPVCIMAGGKGTRLYPYTKVLPKPLIPIGDYTITEHIMQQFLQYGCDQFTVVVNHKKNMIKAFFADEEHQYNIRFIDENKPLGTGGGLSLLRNEYNTTFFLTNCDILVFDDYSKMYQSHRESNNIITIVCATKQITIPYGTIKVDDFGKVSELTEKPSYTFLTNSGFYIVEPEFIKYIPDNTFLHITDAIQSCIDDGKRVGVYPISEECWSDMGQLEELEKMREKIEHT